MQQRMLSLALLIVVDAVEKALILVDRVLD